MAKNSNWTKQGSYSINDKVGSSSMLVEGAEAPRSFADGTGKRKYDKDDPSVGEMRKRRARTYSRPVIGMPWGTFKNASKKSVKSKAKKTKRKKDVAAVPKSKVLPGGAKVMVAKRRKGIMRGFR